MSKKKNAEKHRNYTVFQYVTILLNRIAKYLADVGKMWGKYLYLQQSKIQPESL